MLLASLLREDFSKKFNLMDNMQVIPTMVLIMMQAKNKKKEDHSKLFWMSDWNQPALVLKFSLLWKVPQMVDFMSPIHLQDSQDSNKDKKIKVLEIEF